MYRTGCGLIIMVMAALFAVPAMADDFGKGFEAYDRGDYAAALPNGNRLPNRDMQLRSTISG